MKKIIIYILITAVVITGLAWLREYLSGMAHGEQAGDDPYSEALGPDDPLVVTFSEKHEGDIILACSDDINADGEDDLVVILRGSETNSAVAMVSEDGSYFFTEPTPAPKENQKIGFINIDKGEELEVMISGEKNGQVGYGVFKLIGHDFRNLYGENMKDCC